jgi:hypothetical protein
MYDFILMASPWFVWGVVLGVIQVGGFSKCLSSWLRQIRVVALLVAVWPSRYQEGTTAISLTWTGFYLSSKLDGVAYLNELNKEMYCKEIL